MATYDENLAETQQAGFPELYQFKAGSVIDYVTSWAAEITFLGRKYTPATIKRSGFTVEAKVSSTRLTIEAWLSNRFLRYVSSHPVEPIGITIYRAVEGTLASYAVLFKGEILHLSAKGNHVTGQCEAGSRKLRTRTPRILVQAHCNHDVFDSRCLLNSYTWRVAGAVSSVSGRTLVVPAASGYANGYFDMGTVQFSTDYRLITSHVGDTLTIHAAIHADDLGAGDSVYLLPGCDGDPDTCKSKFNNFVHYLGMPLMPNHNPTIWGVSE